MNHGFRDRQFLPMYPALVAPARIDPSGILGPTRGQARGPRWRRTSKGRYVPTEVDRTIEQRIVEAAAVLPSFGGVTGWAALRWFGANWFDGRCRYGRTERDVILATGQCDIRPQPGIQISAEGMGPRDLSTVSGLRVTSAPRSVLFEMRYAADEREATVALDMAAYDDVVSIAEATQYASLLQTWTGIPKARLALALADENSWSPWETRLRMVWILDAALPRPLCNPPIFDRSGHHIGTPDLLDPETGLIGEYDGGLHLAGRQRRKDVAREGRFRNHGLEYFSVVGSDMHQTDEVVERILSARARATRTRRSWRDWTLTPPSWWTPRRSVEARRRLSLRPRAQ